MQKGFNRSPALALEKDRLLVPAGYQYPIWHEPIRILGNKTVLFAANHENGDSIGLSINGQTVNPSLEAGNKTVWTVRFSDMQDTRLVFFSFHAQDNKSAGITSLEIDYP